LHFAKYAEAIIYYDEVLARAPNYVQGPIQRAGSHSPESANKSDLANVNRSLVNK